MKSNHCIQVKSKHYVCLIQNGENIVCINEFGLKVSSLCFAKHIHINAQFIKYTFYSIICEN